MLSPTYIIHIKSEIGQKNIASPHPKEGHTVLSECMSPCADQTFAGFQYDCFSCIVFFSRLVTLIASVHGVIEIVEIPNNKSQKTNKLQ